MVEDPLDRDRAHGRASRIFIVGVDVPGDRGPDAWPNSSRRGCISARRSSGAWWVLQWPVVFALVASGDRAWSTTSRPTSSRTGSGSRRDPSWPRCCGWRSRSGSSSTTSSCRTRTRPTARIGGIMVLMLWFYGSGLALLLGAELNAEIEHASACGKNPANVISSIGQTVPRRPASPRLPDLPPHRGPKGGWHLSGKGASYLDVEGGQRCPRRWRIGPKPLKCTGVWGYAPCSADLAQGVPAMFSKPMAFVLLALGCLTAAAGGPTWRPATTCRTRRPRLRAAATAPAPTAPCGVQPVAETEAAVTAKAGTQPARLRPTAAAPIVVHVPSRREARAETGRRGATARRQTPRRPSRRRARFR